MAQVYFHYSSARGVMLDRCGTDVDDVIDLQERVTQAVHSLLDSPRLEDWRNWVLHVSDEAGDEILVMPFAEMMGKPH